MNKARFLLNGVTAAALLGLPAAAALAREPDGKGERKEIQRIIVIKDGEGKEHAERRIEEIRRGRDLAMSECKGERSEIDERSDKERTRILVCSTQLSSADRTKRLEETLERIRKDDHLSAEHKAKVETALEQAIARLRETK
ncbi:hypothetical protein E2493_08610 [Sphingomonas parva]|uniref:DUF1090 family protein n=1 Tax=Sphingomonas parva TaxID=2555898 RepID=A0A4Y8ZT62_9SPHN|nr:hypothetical protein [Sphingomonas parva]TFI58687.1 hypothetical protein E2493_08610 [Sphingomonas parva]